MNEAPAQHQDLDAVLAAAWALLARGVRDRRAPAHTPTLATLDPAGLPSLRTVVLRAVDAQRRCLLVHTDQRSSKVADIDRCPAGMVHVYEPALKIQLRLQCHLQVHVDDALATERWAATPARSRECYQVTAAPGTIIAGPEEVVFDAAASADGAAHFCVISATVQRLEWLYLAEAGHRRAAFSWEDDTPLAHWLVP